MTWKHTFSCNDWEHADECNPQQKFLRGRITVLLQNKRPLIREGQGALFETHEPQSIAIARGSRPPFPRPRSAPHWKHR